MTTSEEERHPSGRRPRGFRGDGGAEFQRRRRRRRKGENVTVGRGGKQGSKQVTSLFGAAISAGANRENALLLHSSFSSVVLKLWILSQPSVLCSGLQFPRGLMREPSFGSLYSSSGNFLRKLGEAAARKEECSANCLASFEKSKKNMQWLSLVGAT